jgi:hypothetical protein
VEYVALDTTRLRSIVVVRVPVKDEWGGSNPLGVAMPSLMDSTIPPKDGKTSSILVGGTMKYIKYAIVIALIIIGSSPGVQAVKTLREKEAAQRERAAYNDYLYYLYNKI